MGSEKPRSHFLDERKWNPATLLTFFIGEKFSGADVLSSARMRSFIMDKLETIFNKEGVDLIITPGTAHLPPIVPKGSHQFGESNFVMTLKMMRFIQIALRFFFFSFLFSFFFVFLRDDTIGILLGFLDW